MSVDEQTEALAALHPPMCGLRASGICQAQEACGTCALMSKWVFSGLQYAPLLTAERLSD